MPRIGYILLAVAYIAAAAPTTCALADQTQRECDCRASCTCNVERAMCCCAPQDPRPEPIAPPAKPPDTRKVPAAAQTAAPVEGPEAAARCDGLIVGGTDHLKPIFSQPLYLRIEHFLN